MIDQLTLRGNDEEQIEIRKVRHWVAQVVHSIRSILTCGLLVLLITRGTDCSTNKGDLIWALGKSRPVR